MASTYHSPDGRWHYWKTSTSESDALLRLFHRMLRNGLNTSAKSFIEKCAERMLEGSSLTLAQWKALAPIVKENNEVLPPMGDDPPGTSYPYGPGESERRLALWDAFDGRFKAPIADPDFFDMLHRPRVTGRNVSNAERAFEALARGIMHSMEDEQDEAA